MYWLDLGLPEYISPLLHIFYRTNLLVRKKFHILGISIPSSHPKPFKAVLQPYFCLQKE